jgi:hypothetical protein
MSRSVKFRRASPNGHYDHQRSDSGFSDCESRASNPERDYLTPEYEDQGIYSIRQALDDAHQETAKWKAKAEDLEEKLKEIRNECELTKAQSRALTNEAQVLGQEKDALTKANKDLTEHNAELLDTIKDLKKANRKSSGAASPSTSSATASESSDEKKVRRSSSRRPKESSARPEKEKERGRERDKERDKELRRKEKDRALLEETERLRKRFDSRGDESDAKSSNTSAKSQRNRRDSYIEPLGHGAPRPQAPVPPSPSRTYSSYPATSAPAYSTAPAYPSIREPFTASAPRALHPTVYVMADEYAASYGPGDEDDAASYHTHTHPRSARHPR